MVADNVRALAPRDDAELLERVLLEGDLAVLSSAQRVNYYNRVCESLGLNPLTKPFDYLKLNGKLVLYAKRDAADQLRKRNRVSVAISGREVLGDVYVVTARASTADGRHDESTGAVTVKGLGGEALANAYMKAETKAKRRVTLSFVGLGWMDESEVDSIRGAQRVEVLDTGDIAEPVDPTDEENERARAMVRGGEVGASTAATEAKTSARVKLEASLKRGIEKARGLHLEVADLDVEKLSDQEIKDALGALAEMVKAAESGEDAF